MSDDLTKKLSLVTIPLRLSTIAYGFVAAGAFIFLIATLGMGAPMYADAAEAFIMTFTWAFVLIFSIGLMVLIEQSSKAIMEGKFWGWVTAIILSALYLPSIFVLLGIPLLIGLLSEPVKVHCKVQPAK